MNQWENLFKAALRHIQAAKIPGHVWKFGGGTVLMLNWQHRVSRDIDIFISDPQLLTYFSPRVNDSLDEMLTGYAEQSNFVKLSLPDGEIDFIFAAQITKTAPHMLPLCGENVLCDAPAEIIAKKIHYRHEFFTSRDIFDLACFFQFCPEEADILSFPPDVLDILSSRIKISEGILSDPPFYLLPNGEKIKKGMFELCLAGIKRWQASEKTG